MACLRTFRARVLYKLGVLTCLGCFMKWCAWRASKNGVLGVLRKMACVACLKLIKYNDMFDHGTLVNCGLYCTTLLTILN